MANWTGLLDRMTRTVRATFGEPVSYFRFETGQTITTRPDGEPLTGIFDPDHEPLSASPGSVEVNSRIVVLDMRVADLGFVPLEEDKATVKGVTYRVMKVHPSSSGMMKLQLRRA